MHLHAYRMSLRMLNQGILDSYVSTDAKTCTDFGDTLDVVCKSECQRILDSFMKNAFNVMDAKQNHQLKGTFFH